MIEFKVCPRCRGDLYRAEDMFGKYLSCFQCGYLRDLPNEKLLAAPAPGPRDEEKSKVA
jgi:DNA-directed RNA polymerase subunit M/transcription elongation factor TFIIS